MNEQNKKQFIMLGVLAAVLIGVVIWQVMGSGGATPTPTGKSAAKTAPKATGKAAGKAAAKAGAAARDPMMFQEVDVDIDELLAGIEVVNFDYQAERIDRDPMVPLVGIVRHQVEVARGATPTMAEVMRKRVTGIIYDPQRPAAVVDNEVVNKGYVYPDGIRVDDIQPNRVMFRVGDSIVPVEMRRTGGPL